MSSPHNAARASKFDASKPVPVSLDKTAVVMVGKSAYRTLSVPGLKQPVPKAKRFSIEEANKLFQSIRQLEKRRRTENSQSAANPV